MFINMIETNSPPSTTVPLPTMIKNYTVELSVRFKTVEHMQL